VFEVNKNKKAFRIWCPKGLFMVRLYFYLKYAIIMQISLRSSRNRTTTTTNAHNRYCIAEGTRVDICEIDFHSRKEGVYWRRFANF